MVGRSREAVSTIKGYYFQFDYYILQLLYLDNDEDSVRIEGIEDVDILSVDETRAVQCKYYEGTRCTPSVVGKALRPMLQHFAKHKKDHFTYSLYGHYESGFDEIENPPSLSYAKEKFFTYTEKKKKHCLYTELDLSDDDLKKFLNRLDLDLDTNTYEEQIEEVIAQIKKVLSCNDYDARFFYYNNAVSFVKDVSVKKTGLARTVTRKSFFEAIGQKKFLFDKWYIEYVGFEKYYKNARKQYFSRLNVSSSNRFFLIEVDALIKDIELASIIKEVSRKWSKLSIREQKPCCPYLFFKGLNLTRLTNVKKILFEDDFHIIDGYEFKNAEFSPNSIVRPINYYCGVRARLINEFSQIKLVIDMCKAHREIFQFYVTKPFFDRETLFGKDFLVQRTEDVLKII